MILCSGKANSLSLVNRKFQLKLFPAFIIGRDIGVTKMLRYRMLGLAVRKEKIIKQ